MKQPHQQEPNPAGTHSADLKQKALTALLWSGGTRAVTQVLTWGITIVVIRLLTPEDYGLIAMAMVFVNLLTLMAEAGLGAALVQARQLEEAHLRAIFGASLVVDGILFATLLITAPAIARFFDEPRLVAIISVLALQFVLSVFAVIPAALLARALDFKRPSLIGLLASIAASVTTLALAFSGHGVWSLVAGSLVASLIKTVGLNLACPFLKWPAFSMSGARQLLVFGGEVTGARLLWHLYSQADTVIAGRLLGKELLGFYSVSMHLASLPVQRISAVLNEVAFPAFARTQSDSRLVSEYIVKATRMLSFISFPVLWGISSIAPEIVTVLLGPRWHTAVVPLQLLPLVMPLTLISPFLNAAFQGIGQSRVVLKNVVTACLIMPPAFWIGVRWGLPGLCMAWVLGFPMVLVLNLRRMLPAIGVSGRDFFLAVAASAIPSAAMYASVAMVRHVSAGSVSPVWLMALLTAVGAGVYAGLASLANRRIAVEFIGLFQSRLVR